MIGPGLPRLRASVPRWALPGLVVVLIAGLMWMHALSSGHHTGADPMAAEQVTSITAADQCKARGGHTCPTDLPKHSGPICQSGAVPSAAATVLASGAFMAHGRIGVALPVPLSVLTAAPDSGGGSGCGPPSLAMLSISRT